MKQVKFTALLAAMGIVITMLLLTGCGGGQESHDEISPYTGSVIGMTTAPPSADIEVDTDTWIGVFWNKPDFPPPAEFTFRLEELDDDSWDGVNTKKVDASSDPDKGEWWFEPTYDLSSGTWYRIVVTDQSGQKAIVCFRTEDSRSSFSAQSTGPVPGRFRPAGAENVKSSGISGDGTVEHVINR